MKNDHFQKRLDSKLNMQNFKLNLESLKKLIYEKNLILTLAHLLDLPGNEFQCLKWAKTGFL